MTIDRLESGGLITNYFCTSRCGHCLYASSPHWPKQYIDRETTAKNLEKIKSLGCRSVHVGGGEPFLDLAGLTAVIETAQALEIGLEYVETNASWFQDIESAGNILKSLKKAGLLTILISISPFHNEYIPFYKVKGLIQACRLTKMNLVPWLAEFYNEIDNFYDRRPHGLEEYEKLFGPKYLPGLLTRYPVRLAGRALVTFAPRLEKKKTEPILAAAKGGCPELKNTTHFHVDLFGRYLPGLCPGLALQVEDLGRPVSLDDYPFLGTLFLTGIKGLLDLAVQEHGFEPAEGYVSKCHLCQEIRRFLVLEKNTASPDLQPQEFYLNLYRSRLKNASAG